MLKTFFILNFLSVIIFAKAQTSITGIVTDKNNNPVSLAIISIAGKNASTVTDDDGEFVLPLKNTMKGAIITVRVTKAGFSVFSKAETVSELALIIHLTKTNKLKSDPSAKNARSKGGGYQIIEPNAQIITQNQSGGANSVVNNNYYGDTIPDSLNFEYKIIRDTAIWLMVYPKKGIWETLFAETDSVRSNEQFMDIGFAMMRELHGGSINIDGRTHKLDGYVFFTNHCSKDMPLKINLSRSDPYQVYLFGDRQDIKKSYGYYRGTVGWVNTSSNPNQGN